MGRRGSGVVLAMLAVTLAGCSGDGNPIVHTAEQTYSVSAPVGMVLLDARMASVTVEAGEGPVSVTETLRYTGSKPTVTHRVDGTALQLRETGCGDGVRLRCDVAYRLRVPAATALQVTTKAGAVTVRGLAGQLTVTTDAGAINGQRLATARVTVTTRAGVAKLQFAAAPARVEATTELGAVEVRVPGDRAYAVDVSADVGAADVTVRRDAGSPHQITVRTKVGAVRVAAT
jgi:hypothetical protein